MAAWPGFVYRPGHQRAAAGLWPLVGLLTGLAGAGAGLLALGLGLAPGVAVVLALVALAWLTGALHEDGFADVCDGLGAGAGALPPEQALAVMRDPRNGSYATLGLTLLVLFKAACLHALTQAGGAALLGAALVSGQALSRLAALGLMPGMAYVGAGRRAGGMGQDLPAPAWLAALAFGLAPLALLAPALPPGMPDAALTAAALVPPLAGVWWLRRLFARRLGGYSGDCLGAAQQLAEALFYLGLCALAGAAAGNSSPAGLSDWP